jgi:hypothetical protein
MFHPAPTPSVPGLRSMEAILSLIGWRVQNAEIDLVAGRVVVELHRYDGRWAHLVVDSLGRATIERWQRVSVVTRWGRKGPECDGFRDDFLGRSRCEGPRDGLRVLARYVADNPSPGFEALPVSGIRDAFRSVMGPRQIEDRS